MGNMNELVQEKSQEISFAIIRIAAYVRRFDLRKKLESLAFHLIENVYYDNTDLVLDTLRTIDGFLDLGSSIYEIEPVNARIIKKEVLELKNAIENGSAKQGVDIASVFKKKLNLEKETGNKEIIRKKEVPTKTRVVGPSAGERRKKIQEILDNSGNLQLKEIAISFPDVTSRTLRYDLKEMVESGLVIRQGSGPASTYFAPKTPILDEMVDEPVESGSGTVPGVINL